MTSAVATAGAGPLLRRWRERRRLSQLALALDAGVSARHLSFVETGRSRPSAAMVLNLAQQLEVPLRDRNRLLLAAGHAPAFEEHGLDEPQMAPIRDTIQLLLDAHEPYPALVVDGAWEMLAANRAVALFTDGVAEELLAPPLNVLRVSLHPDGLASRIINLGDWRAHIFERLERQIAVTGSPALAALLDELRAYPGPEPETGAHHDIALPLQVHSAEGEELSFIGTIATFGTAAEITASELSIETFFPADTATAAAVATYVARLPAT